MKSTKLKLLLDKQKGIRGSRFLSVRYFERLIEAGINALAGSVADSCDNALAESIIGLFRTEVLNSSSHGKR